ncbi:MAG: sigma factor-like helix-turn-helix DNA-binding protein [Egibacteraceae bacterium]
MGPGQHQGAPTLVAERLDEQAFAAFVRRHHAAMVRVTRPLGRAARGLGRGRRAASADPGGHRHAPGAPAAVITLRDIEGWPAAEICALLGLTDANQRVLLHRALPRPLSPGALPGLTGTRTCAA